MRRFVKITILLFTLCTVSAFAHRLFNNSPIKIIHPFFLKRDMPISKHWYYLFLGDMISYSCLWLWICSTIRPLKNHLKELAWIGHNPYLVFSTLWYNIFLICFVSSLLDIIHYLLAFKTFEWWFVVQTSAFTLTSVVLICKSYFKKWRKKKT